jgi:hypothetical protein
MSHSGCLQERGITACQVMLAVHGPLPKMWSPRSRESDWAVLRPKLRRKLGSESVKTQFSKIYFSQTYFYRSYKLARPISSYLCLSNTANLVLIEYLISLIITMLCWPPQANPLVCRKPSRVLSLLL